MPKLYTVDIEDEITVEWGFSNRMNCKGGARGVGKGGHRIVARPGVALVNRGTRAIGVLDISAEVL